MLITLEIFELGTKGTLALMCRYTKIADVKEIIEVLMLLSQCTSTEWKVQRIAIASAQNSCMPYLSLA